MKRTLMQRWTPRHAADLYGIKDWGAGYFDLSDDGFVTVSVDFPTGKTNVKLLDIVNGISERGLPMPVLLRIENLLDARIAAINEAFSRAIKKLEYNGSYRGVFPIKVNQQCQVIQEVAKFGTRYGHGLEAGSKAELIIALSTLKPEGGFIICNGYKDEEFITLGLLAQKIGFPIFFVIETPTELAVILKCSRELGVRPRIGLRAKLASKVGGHWNATSGDRSIFGLTTSQIVSVIDELRQMEMLDCLQLLHFHLGSQIPNIRDIRTGVLEACRFYADLKKEGAAMGYLDLGGGLAVDYDGSKTNYTHSKNYNLDEYCEDIIEVVMTTLDPENIEHPTIITESGRSTVAYGSVLLFNILEVTHFEPGSLPDIIPEQEHAYIHNLYAVINALNGKNIQECYNDALYYRDEIRELFRRGQISLRSRSLAEDIFLAIMQRVALAEEKAAQGLPELEGLRDLLSDIYYGNFSVFQSLPDIWAIDQVFPIMPIHRLDEAPEREAIIADITCDCDGKIDRFPALHDEKKTLSLHPLKPDEEYCLGVFLVGAYQETLGDLHNLLGDTHVASVRINDDGSFDFIRELEGDSVADVLSYVEYHPQSLLEDFRKSAEQAVRYGRISVSERKQLMEAYSASLRGYTYFER